MKYSVKKYLMALLCVLALLGCKENGKTGSDSSASSENTLDKDASYALGMNIGSNMKTNSIVPDTDEFLQGFKEALAGGKTRFTGEEAEAKLEQAFTALMEKENEGSRQAEIDFLAENSKKEGIIITGSGLQYEVISEGSGAKPAASDTVRVNYEGTFTDGSVFDSSFVRGEPVEFPLNGVIPGWTEGIQLMSEGANYRFYIPSELAYGPQGNQRIPPYSPLIFNVELLAMVE
jgi:FKBP-type peptidyl-prolyl cis-trans isomerase